MIVAAQPEATEAGAEILKAGGNAVDAAMACAFVQGVVDPLMCGIAGFGSCGIAMPATGFHGYIDFHAPAPLAVRPDMWADRIESEARDGFGFILRGRVNDIGYQAICAPASLRAYRDAHREHGRLPWEQILEPAIAWAEAGWTVRPHVGSWWAEDGQMGRAANHERLAFTPASRALYCRPDGTPKRVGDRVVNRDLGQTLRLIAKHGDEVFYEGEIAHAIVEDMRKHDGLLGAEDLRGWRTTRNAPLWATYRRYRVSSNRPPGGGVMLLEMLNILEHFDLKAIGHNTTDYIRIVCEAMRIATADKERHVGDPAFVEVPLARLTGQEYAAGCAARIRAGERARVERVTGESAQTTHVAVVDRDGNCVTMTHSLGMPSGVISDGLGFMYNGCMSVFDPRPGHAGSIAPGKSRFSSLCPSIVFDGDAPRIVIGAPGGTQIAMGVLQALLNIIDHGMPIDRAVSMPRFSATSNAIDITNRIPDYTVEPLRAAGYEVIRSALTFHIGAVHGITIDAGGKLAGGADPGHDGVALAV